MFAKPFATVKGLRGHRRRALLPNLVPALIFLAPSLGKNPSADPGAKLMWELDSLKREVQRDILTEKDKAAIRECGRSKDSLMHALRSGAPDYAEVDKAIMQAKLEGKTPAEESVRRLMERKFALEEGFNRRFESSKKGKWCLEQEARRAERLEAALERHEAYRRKLREIESLEQDSGGEPRSG